MIFRVFNLFTNVPLFIIGNKGCVVIRNSEMKQFHNSQSTISRYWNIIKRLATYVKRNLIVKAETVGSLILISKDPLPTKILFYCVAFFFFFIYLFFYQPAAKCSLKFARAKNKFQL